MHSCHVRWLFALALAMLPAALPASLPAQAATGVVRGRVTDAATNQPLPGVTVAVDGTQLGALTSDRGEYSIAAVPAGRQTVRVRRLGFAAEARPVDVTAGETTTADFALRAAAVALDEVVVTGTAAPTSRRALGTSVATVDSAVIERSQAVTVDQALQGKIAGAQITQNSGAPGGGGISVRLRGTSSFISGSDPLYIVDGVIVDNSSESLRELGSRGNVQNRIADINPADIERIEVIRGAAAAALYGSRANNGVVQIFTRRGRAGQRPQITLQTRAAATTVPKTLEINDLPFDAQGLPVTRIDEQDFIFRTGSTYENNLSVSGGNEQTRYYVNGTWTEEEGIQEASSASRRGGRVNLSQQVTPRLGLELGANFVNSHSEFQVNGEGTGVLTSFLFNPTTYDPRPVDGVYPFAPVLNPNPLLQLDRFRNPQDVNRFIGSVAAKWNPISRVTASYTFGYDGYSLEQGAFFPRGAFPGGADATGLAANDVRNSRILNQDAVVNVVAPAGAFEFTTSGGVNYTSQRIRTTVAQARDLIPVVEVVGGASPFASQRIVDLKTLGFYGQESVAWRDRLYLTGAVRWDASSTFGAEERWQVFPKASLSYVISEEDWFRNALPERWVSSLRLRTALGYAGNQPSILNAYSRFNEYERVTFGGLPGVVNSVILGNEALKPERQREWEVGADLGFVDNRISLEATYYDKLVDDILLFRPVAPTTGYTRQFSAIGAMSNKGVELLLRTVNVDRPNLRWDMTATYTRNRNIVERLDIPDFQSAAGYPNRVKEGDPVGVFYGVYAARNCQTGAYLLDSLGRQRPSTSLPTDIEARRALSGGSCNDSTNRILGDPNPAWIGSLLNEFTVAKNLRFRVLLDGSFGNDVMNLSRRIRDLGGALNSPEAERELLPYGDPRKLPPGYLARRLGIFSEYVEDGTFVKLREVSASYTLDQPWVTRYLSGGVELTLSGRNLYTWTDYSGYDPEVNLFGQNSPGVTLAGATNTTAADRGFDFATIPIPRTWSIGARFTY
jgi:TonB-dependent starch-binding outer membrane protein SusC